ncbi:MAG: hypothetical protein AABX17_02420 [Nanoarchaeota archaeon]|mgnify:CR=1 FL=1
MITQNKRHNLKRFLVTGVLFASLSIATIGQNETLQEQIKDITDVDLHEEKMFSEYTSAEKTMMAQYRITNKETYTAYMENKFDIQPTGL